MNIFKITSNNKNMGEYTKLSSVIKALEFNLPTGLYTVYLNDNKLMEVKTNQAFNDRITFSNIIDLYQTD